MSLIDPRFMDLAMRLADAQTGLTGMNPAVGAVIVKGGRVVGTGATATGGRPHAETQALAQAGFAARGATAYMTLEPCAHHGGTPPCADALVEARLSKVVCAWRDPNGNVNGKGFARLREAGIEVAALSSDLGDGLQYFFTNQILERPFIAVKMATSMDGRIALSNGESRWISSAHARRFTRALRSRFHAIGVGANTVLYDDPQLTTRVNGLKNPRPVVFDQRGRVPKGAKLGLDESAILVSEADVEHWSGETLPANPHELSALMPKLLKAGISSLLVEGGGELVASFIRANLVDRFYHVSTGALMGADARSAIGALGLLEMKDVPRAQLTRRVSLGGDTLLQYDVSHFDQAKYRADA